MLKSKGTQAAIEAALQFCGVKINKQLQEEGRNPEIKDTKLGTTCTYYVTFKDFDSKLFSKLRQMLLPANIQLCLLPAD